MHQMNEETFQRERAEKDVSAETFFEIEREHEDLGLEIDAMTAVTAWHGEVMDYGLAVETLLRRDHRVQQV